MRAIVTASVCVAIILGLYSVTGMTQEPAKPSSSDRSSDLADFLVVDKTYHFGPIGRGFFGKVLAKPKGQWVLIEEVNLEHGKIVRLRNLDRVEAIRESAIKP